MVRLMKYLLRNNGKTAKPSKESKKKNHNAPSKVKRSPSVHIDMSSCKQQLMESKRLSAVAFESIGFDFDSDFDDEYSQTTSSTFSTSSSHLPQETQLQDEEQSEDNLIFGRKETKGRKTPDLWCYASNHIMINKERENRGLAPLMRESELDGIARRRAAEMAKANSVDCEDPSILQSDISMAHTRVGENVGSGHSIHHINSYMMGDMSQRSNLVDKGYKYMGTGTAKGKDGQIYLCQIFIE